MSRFASSANRIAQSDTGEERHGLNRSPSFRIMVHPSALQAGGAVAISVRPYAQLFLIESGVLRLAVPSGKWTLRQTDAMWVPAFTFYELAAESAVTFYAVELPHRFHPGSAPDDSRLTRISPLLRELVRQLAKAPADYDPNGHFGRVASLIPETLQWPAVPEIPLPHLEDERLHRIQQALLADPSDRRTLQQWADFTHTSCRTLARLFQKEAGACFCDWRNQLRLSIALPMLAQGDPVTSVAYSVGFESPGTFTTMFRRFMNMNPSQYAARTRQTNNPGTADAPGIPNGCDA
ncbi:MAG: AraC family transcriptional regulator [Acidobacteriota bacterium]|nr:AraC family transcriptional regulator [Acidobacteriota bacterium]